MIIDKFKNYYFSLLGCVFLISSGNNKSIINVMLNYFCKEFVYNLLKII